LAEALAPPAPEAAPPAPPAPKPSPPAPKPSLPAPKPAPPVPKAAPAQAAPATVAPPTVAPPTVAPPTLAPPTAPPQAAPPHAATGGPTGTTRPPDLRFTTPRDTAARTWRSSTNPRHAPGRDGGVHHDDGPPLAGEPGLQTEPEPQQSRHVRIIA